MKKDNGMTIMGIGEKLGLSTLPYLVFVIYCTYRYQSFGTSALPKGVMIALGIVMVIAGLTINFLSAFQMMKAFRNGKLLTSGTYGITRNPMYASFIFITIPGIALIINSWLFLTVSIWIYVFFKIYISNEEKYLARKFGNQYRNYCRSVGQLFPRVRR